MKYFFLLLILNLSSHLYALASDPPFQFYENKGQWEEGVFYSGKVSSGELFLLENAIIYHFYDASALERHHSNPDPGHKVKSAAGLKTHALNIEFTGASTQSIKAAQTQKARYNFFLGEDKSRWASGVRSFGKVIYNQLYPGIDLQYYASGGHLKYDFIVAPNGDPNLIKVTYNGAEELSLENGNLKIRTSVNDIVERKPFAYQLIGKDTIPVACHYVLEDNVLSYNFPDGYDKSQELIIDPILIFSTYSGSTADNWGNTATYDTLGNLYSGGTVFNVGFPATTGAYQMNYSGNTDIGILKFDSTGSSLLYATYLGGFDTEVPLSLVVDNNHELIILGVTGSADYPVTDDAYQKDFKGGLPSTPMGGITYNNGSDIFISKLSEDGSQLLASTYIGGTDNDGLLHTFEDLTKNYGDQFRSDIIFDDENQIYIASHTNSSDFPAVNSFSDTHKGNHDALVFKMSGDLSTLIWSTYLGGSGIDAAYSIKLDQDKNVFVAGGTMSTNFPVSATAYKTTKPNAFDIDGFVTSISADGNEILSSTYIGTSSYDQVYFLDLDLNDKVFVLGQTTGQIPIIDKVYNNPNSGQFIQKFDHGLSTLEMSTVFGSGGGRPNISPTAFLVNTCGSIFITGWGGDINSSFNGFIGGTTFNMPITKDAFQPDTDGSDFYMIVLSEDVTELLYATYFGGKTQRGEHVDGGTSRFDKRGIVYQAVCGGCGGNSQFPTTPGVWSNINQSPNCNNAAFKYDLSTLRAYFTPDKNEGCPPLEVNFDNQSSGGITHTWDFDGDIIESMDESISYSFTEPGEYTVTLTVEDDKTCIGKDVYTETISVLDADFNISLPDTICVGESVQLMADGGTSYTWSPEVGLSNSNIANPLATPSETTTYSVLISVEDFCQHQDSVQIVVHKDISIDFDYNTNVDCIGSPSYSFQNQSLGLKNFLWDFGDGSTSTDYEPVHEYGEQGDYTVRLKGLGQDCVDDQVKNISVRDMKVPNIFTPNSDSKNEHFEVVSTEEFKLGIYDRWGKLLYESDPYLNDWNGDELASGVYYYEIVFNNADVCKGWLHILK